MKYWENLNVISVFSLINSNEIICFLTKTAREKFLNTLIIKFVSHMSQSILYKKIQSRTEIAIFG